MNTPSMLTMQAYKVNDVEGVKTQLEALTGWAKVNVRRNISFLALLERKAKMLEYILTTWEEGDLESWQRCRTSGINEYLDEMDRVDEEKQPATFRVVEQSQLRSQHPRKPAKERDREALMCRAAAIFDVGSRCEVIW